MFYNTPAFMFYKTMAAGIPRITAEYAIIEMERSSWFPGYRTILYVYVPYYHNGGGWAQECRGYRLCPEKQYFLFKAIRVLPPVQRGSWSSGLCSPR